MFSMKRISNVILFENVSTFACIRSVWVRSFEVHAVSTRGRV